MFRLPAWMQLDLFASKAPGPATEPIASLPPDSAWPGILAAQEYPMEVVFSARARQGWSLSWRPGQALRLRLPESLAQAPSEVALWLVNWALLASSRRKTQANKASRRGYETQIRAYIDSQNPPGENEGRKLKRARLALAKMQTQGHYHDLQKSFDRVNARYFSGELRAHITWIRRLGGLSTHCQRPHPEGGLFHLITISQGYDAPDAGHEILDGVVYHECLHIVYPPQILGGRRIVHGRDFRQAERAYPHFDAWMRWHRQGLPLSLRRLRSQARTRKTQR